MSDQGLATGDQGSFPNLPNNAPQWGLFQNGSPVVDADSVIMLEYTKTWTISDFPVESGAFESYDRVELPFEGRLRYTKGGMVSDRNDFLTSIDAISAGGNTQLYDLVMPERVLQNVSVNHVGFSRTSESGLGLMIADVWVTEVRVTASVAFSNTKTPGGASPVGGGNVQTQQPTQTENITFTGDYNQFSNFSGGGGSFGGYGSSYNGGAGW